MIGNDKEIERMTRTHRGTLNLKLGKEVREGSWEVMVFKLRLGMKRSQVRGKMKWC